MKSELTISNAVAVDADAPNTYLRLLLAKYLEVRNYRVAERLHISPALLSMLLTGRVKLTPEMAENIGRAILDERDAQRAADTLAAREASARARSAIR